MATKVQGRFDPKLIGARIGVILKTLDLTQVEFAERCGLTQSAVSQIVNENRVPSMKSICRILEVLPVKFESLARVDP